LADSESQPVLSIQFRLADLLFLLRAKLAQVFSQFRMFVGENRNRSAALVAPALPIANVPTGNPAGI